MRRLALVLLSVTLVALAACGDTEERVLTERAAHERPVREAPTIDSTTTTLPPTTTTTIPPTTTTQPQIQAAQATEPVIVEPPPPPPSGGECAGWYDTIVAYFGQDQASRACRVMLCESGGNPRAYNPSGASGLFQVMPGWADEYEQVTRQPYYDGRFNGDANTMFAAWLLAHGGWSHWVCTG